VAAVAVAAKITLVDIVTLVALVAAPRIVAAMVCHWVGVTGTTAQLFVRAGQWVAGLQVVIKVPQSPVVGVVTYIALFTHNPLMVVGILVAADAVVLCLPITGIKVTRLTGGNGVLARQRKGAEIVVEADLLAPTD